MSSYDDWKTDAPDPGTVETDDRCPYCGVPDGVPCYEWCGQMDEDEDDGA